MNPNEGFKSQLKVRWSDFRTLSSSRICLQEYEPIFKAREQFQALNYTPDMILRQGERRRAAPDEDEDEDMGGDDMAD